MHKSNRITSRVLHTAGGSSFTVTAVPLCEGEPTLHRTAQVLVRSILDRLGPAPEGHAGPLEIVSIADATMIPAARRSRTSARSDRDAG
jgi:hypothetical protein